MNLLEKKKSFFIFLKMLNTNNHDEDNFIFIHNTTNKLINIKFSLILTLGLN